MKYTQLTKLAARLENVSPSATLALAQKAREMAAAGHDVVSLTAGEPDFRPAPHILEAAVKAMERGDTRYTAVPGIEELREAIRAYFLRRDGLGYELNEVMVSTGAKQSIYNALAAMVGPNDEVIIVAPYWLSYRDITLLCGGTPVVVQTDEAGGFRLTAAQLDQAITTRTKVLVLNSPSNPSGAGYTREDFAALAEVLRRNPGVTVLSDEIYRQLAFDPAIDTSILTAAPDLIDRVIVVDGASKAYAMTGFRIGWAAGPRNVISAMTRIQGQTTSSLAASLSTQPSPRFEETRAS